MSEASYLESTILDTLTGGYISWFKDKAKTTVFYQNVQKKLNPEGYSSEVRLVLDASINQAKNTLPDDFDTKIVDNNISKNKELIYEWITMVDGETDFPKEEERIQYQYPDEKKIVRTFFNSLFYSIFANRTRYPSLISLQMQREIKDLKKGQQTIIDLNLKTVSMLESFLGGNTQLHFADELEEIENYLTNRQYKTARVKAFTIEKKIRQINKREELEKLYQLIVNTFLMDIEIQEESIPYFEYLIAYTDDAERKIYRRVLFNIIKRDFDTAQQILNIEFERTGNDKNKLYHLQLNIYLVNNKLNEAIDFLSIVKEDFKDYPFWYSKINLLQFNYGRAHDVISEYKDYFQTEKYDLKRLKFEIEISYYNNLLQNGKRGFQEIEKFLCLIKEADELIELTREEDSSKCTLFCQKAYILMITDQFEDAEKMYEEAEKIDSNNPLLLRNYPLVLARDNNFEKNKKAVNLLSIYREENDYDIITENLYFHSLIITNTKIAVEELTALSICEENLLIKVMLAQALDKDLKTNEAGVFLDKLFVMFPKNIHVLHSLGRHDVRCGNQNKAISYYEEALKYLPLEPFKSIIIHELIVLYLKKRDKYFIDRSRKLLEQEYSKEFIILYPLQIFI